MMLLVHGSGRSRTMGDTCWKPLTWSIVTQSSSPEGIYIVHTVQQYQLKLSSLWNNRNLWLFVLFTSLSLIKLNLHLYPLTPVRMYVCVRALLPDILAAWHVYYLLSPWRPVCGSYLESIFERQYIDVWCGICYYWLCVNWENQQILQWCLFLSKKEKKQQQQQKSSLLKLQANIQLFTRALWTFKI